MRDEERLIRSLDGDLSESETKMLREKLLSDHGLAVRREAWEAVREEVVAGKPEFEPGFRDRVMARLREIPVEDRHAAHVDRPGADALSLINTLLGMAVDIRTRQPKLANITGGLSGPAIRPVALRMVWQVAQTVKIPVVGMGGIMTARDALEFLIAGATAVQVGTALYVDPALPARLVSELSAHPEWIARRKGEK